MRTFLFLLSLLAGNLVSAQTYTVIADSLRLPNGLEVDAQGRLWVVEVGYGFNDGAVSILQPDGSLLPVLVGLPSVFDTVEQESVGPWHTLALPGNKLAVTIGAIGQVVFFDLNGFTPGLSAPLTMAQAIGSLDIYTYAMSQGFLESDPYTLAADGAGNLYIADAAANAVIKATQQGQLSVFATFPGIPNPIPVGPPISDAVPTRIVAKPGGGFYVCQLTGFPFLEGGASVFSLDANGNLTPYATGLTMLTDMALNTNTGDLYALQLGVFDLSIFNIAPNAAKVWRLHPNGTREIVAENFDLSPGMILDAQGNLYVTELAQGRVLKYDGIATNTHENASDLIAFSLSPNPAADLAHIGFSLRKASDVEIQVLDQSGKIVYSKNLGALEAGQHEGIWPCENQAAGVYWVDIRTKTGMKTQKLILK